MHPLGRALFMNNVPFGSISWQLFFFGCEGQKDAGLSIENLGLGNNWKFISGFPRALSATPIPEP